MMDVSISGTRPRCLKSTDIMRALRLTLRATKTTPSGGVSVAFVSDAKMRALNKRWRRKDRTTDVLSFAPPEIPLVQAAARQWGDIFVSSAFVQKEARRRGIAFREELLRVIVHGMLHLLGYDHATEKEEKEMFSIQERCLVLAQQSV